MALTLSSMSTRSSIDFNGTWHHDYGKPIKVREEWIVHIPSDDKLREKWQAVAYTAYYYNDKLMAVKGGHFGAVGTVVLSATEVAKGEERALAAVKTALRIGPEWGEEGTRYCTASRSMLLDVLDEAIRDAVDEIRRMEKEGDYEVWPGEKKEVLA